MMNMNPNIVLQTLPGLTYDFTTFPGTIILIMISAVIVAVAFLGIYFAYTTIGRQTAIAEQTNAIAQRKAAFQETQDVVKQAKADMLADFQSLVDLDKKMKESLTLAHIEEAALAKATA